MPDTSTALDTASTDELIAELRRRAVLPRVEVRITAGVMQELLMRSRVAPLRNMLIGEITHQFRGALWGSAQLAQTPLQLAERIAPYAEVLIVQPGTPLQWTLREAAQQEEHAYQRSYPGAIEMFALAQHEWEKRQRQAIEQEDNAASDSPPSAPAGASRPSTTCAPS